MKTFEIAFHDEFEATDLQDAIDQLIAYLNECIINDSVSGFGIYEIPKD